ncbi:hypothetical protein V6N13_128529 [Hibiscus sabdariffa]
MIPLADEANYLCGNQQRKLDNYGFELYLGRSQNYKQELGTHDWCGELSPGIVGSMWESLPTGYNMFHLCSMLYSVVKLPSLAPQRNQTGYNRTVLPQLCMLSVFRKFLIPLYGH